MTMQEDKGSSSPEQSVRPNPHEGHDSYLPTEHLTGEDDFRLAKKFLEGPYGDSFVAEGSNRPKPAPLEEENQPTRIEPSLTMATLQFSGSVFLFIGLSQTVTLDLVTWASNASEVEFMGVAAMTAVGCSGCAGFAKAIFRVFRRNSRR